jgi:hypothetical protein
LCPAAMLEHDTRLWVSCLWSFKPVTLSGHSIRLARGKHLTSMTTVSSTLRTAQEKPSQSMQSVQSALWPLVTIGDPHGNRAISSYKDFKWTVTSLRIPTHFRKKILGILKFLQIYFASLRQAFQFHQHTEAKHFSNHLLNWVHRVYVKLDTQEDNLHQPR